MEFLVIGQENKKICRLQNFRHATHHSLLLSCSILLATICLTLISATAAQTSLNDLYALQIDLPPDLLKDVVVSATLSAGFIYAYNNCLEVD